MSGHSKWSKTKHIKAAQDSKRGKIFTKLIRELTVAARLGGGDLEANPRLRTVYTKAREQNMPLENIQRAILRGTGQLPGTAFEEVAYEGYGPGGVALLIQTTTDNRHRTSAEIRHLLAKFGGNLGEAGCVSWMFVLKGYFLVEQDTMDEERLMGLVLEAGAEDLRSEEKHYAVLTPPQKFESVKAALGQAGIVPSVAEITQVPQSTVQLEGRAAERMLRLTEALDDHDDVQQVYANFDIPDEVMEKAVALT